jgi:hypothetical protein
LAQNNIGKTQVVSQPNRLPPPYGYYNNTVTPSAPPAIPINYQQQQYVVYQYPNQYQQQYYPRTNYPQQYQQQPSMLATMGAVAGGVILGDMVGDVLFD